MSRHMPIPFQHDRPLFVRIPFRAASKSWKVGNQFKWLEMSMDRDKITILYTQGYLIHDEDREVGLAVGDGLENLDMAGLHSVVDKINVKVKIKVKTQSDYLKKSCKKSKILDKQRGLIRTWRRVYGKLELD
jgi:hypothetical protein